MENEKITTKDETMESVQETTTPTVEETEKVEAGVEGTTITETTNPEISTTEETKQTEEKEKEKPDKTPTDADVEEMTSIVEATTPETTEVEEEPTETLEELKAKIQEMEDEKQEKQSLNELFEAENQAKRTLDETVERVKNAFTETLKQYQIPLDKPLEELKKENPAQAAIVESVYNQAMNTIATKQKELQDSLTAKQGDLVIRKASKVFKKFEMNTEQKLEAASTFAEIMRTVGFVDLDEDLKRKVELCVADAMMKHPNTKEVTDVQKPTTIETIETTETQDMDKMLEEQAKEKELNEKNEKLKKEQESELESELSKGVAVGNSQPQVTVDNVLDIFSGLSSKDRAVFYKKHADVINEACKKAQRK